MNTFKRILFSKEFLSIRAKFAGQNTYDFSGVAEVVRDELDLRMMLSLRDKEKIPAVGRLLIVANHPLAFLDLIAVYTVITEVRSDIVVIADNLPEYAQGHDVIRTAETSRLTAMRRIHKALIEEKAVILLPAESRHWGLGHIRDGNWPKYVPRIATRWDTPVLPIFVAARNRLQHYFWTWASGLYSDISLDSEMVSQKHRAIALTLSHPIMPDALRGIKAVAAAKLLRKHVHQICRGRAGTFKTTRNIVHPTDKKAVLTDIDAAEVLGETEDKIRILLVRYAQAPALMREIGRLRELTFRKVGEGTGKKIDLDQFDQWYQHIVLWDARALEVVGAYRLALGDEVYRERGVAGFYTSTLFRFAERFETCLPQALELGRSFVQPAYWNSQALDYLWHGIGAFIAKRPQYKYLFGPVSVSATYTQEARELLVSFYRRWFGAVEAPVRAKHRFIFSQGAESRLSSQLTAGEYKQAFKELKQNLKHYGFAVPTLYKQYTELCEDGGVRFYDFGIDKDFMMSLDGFIFLEIAKIREAKLARYVYSKLNGAVKPAAFQPADASAAALS